MTNTIKEIQDKLQEAAPALTQEVLELLWKWIEAKQDEMYHKQLGLQNDTDSQKKLNNVNRPPLPERPKPSIEPVMDITLKSLINDIVEAFKGSFQFWKHFFGC